MARVPRLRYKYLARSPLKVTYAFRFPGPQQNKQQVNSYPTNIKTFTLLGTMANHNGTQQDRKSGPKYYKTRLFSQPLFNLSNCFIVTIQAILY
jgi:hypothetical protein